MNDAARNEGLSEAQVLAYPVFDRCTKPCCGTTAGGRSFTQKADEAFQRGIDPEGCLKGIEVVLGDGTKATVSCPYGSLHPGFIAAMGVVVASRQG